MYIGEQIINPTEDRLRLSTQLGCAHVVVDTRPNVAVLGEDGSWSPTKVAGQRRWIESLGLSLDALALDVGSFLLDTLYCPERARATASRLRHDIRAAAEGGVPLLKYNVQMVGITRTGLAKGRGGVQCSTFHLADYSPGRDATYSYWGVSHPGSSMAGTDAAANAPGSGGAAGQVLAREVPGVSEQQGWDAIEALVEAILPEAEACGIRLACHPHDPAYPPGGLNGVAHVLGSLEGMRRFAALAPGSRSHGFNFCQGTIAEMEPDPTACVLQAIREFGAMDKIFMVHFRNIQGGYLDFRETFPDEGSVDMAACVRAYRSVGYAGILCPDHVPLSDLDPARERFFSFALGYTRGLLHATA